jgi:hypothetical protein
MGDLKDTLDEIINESYDFEARHKKIVAHMQNEIERIENPEDFQEPEEEIKEIPTTSKKKDLTW